MGEHGLNDRVEIRLADYRGTSETRLGRSSLKAETRHGRVDDRFGPDRPGAVEERAGLRHTRQDSQILCRPAGDFPREMTRPGPGLCELSQRPVIKMKSDDRITGVHGLMQR
jgi:hypothetical protein